MSTATLILLFLCANTHAQVIVDGDNGNSLSGTARDVVAGVLITTFGVLAVITVVSVIMVRQRRKVPTGVTQSSTSRGSFVYPMRPTDVENRSSIIDIEVLGPPAPPYSEHESSQAPVPPPPAYKPRAASRGYLPVNDNEKVLHA
ncbi:hypothetical protein ONZ45_g12388 [Pleurotus djamor]|nr:hypothetical protein ONZ45_g12388 [Pleurotus djamor]